MKERVRIVATIEMEANSEFAITSLVEQVKICVKSVYLFHHGFKTKKIGYHVDTFNVPPNNHALGKWQVLGTDKDQGEIKC